IYAPSTGVSGYIQRNNGSLSPTNITDDLLLGGISTSSAKIAFLNMAGGTPTASISGNLSLAVPTTAGANTFNLLNNSTLNFQRSAGGDAGLTSALFIQSNGNIGIGTTAPAALTEIKGAGGSTTGVEALRLSAEGDFYYLNLPRISNVTNRGLILSHQWVPDSTEIYKSLIRASGGVSESIEIMPGFGTSSLGILALTPRGSSVNIGDSNYLLSGSKLNVTNSYFQSVQRDSTGAGSYTDNSTEAKTTKGTAYTVLSGTSDLFYVGTNIPFSSVYFGLARNGVGGTGLAAEYWNESAWTSLSITDGTSNLTQSGTVTFTPPTAWAMTTVVGNRYWIRFKFTGAPSTSPTAYLTTMENQDLIGVYANAGDSNTAFTVKSNGNVGINTSSPIGLLNVSGESVGKALVNLNYTGTGENIFTASASGVTKFTLDASGNASLSGTLAVNTIKPLTGALNLQYKSGGNAWSDGITLLDNSGNVGIGTTNPGAKLSVKSSAYGNNMLIGLAQDSGTAFAFLDDASGNGIGRIYDTSGNVKVSLLASGVSYFNGG
ncbi:MAG: hypothetical protein Q8O68_00010, partial [Candidatus Daviesbacteria bacterium]|nr:hypothetical protein [Candidatus Daviesbacteria bacterium]